MKCKICEKELKSEPFIVKEMMFGTQDTFEYVSCEHCLCLQIIEKPANLHEYYDNTSYISFKKVKYSWITKWIRYLRNHYALYDKSIIGKFLYTYFPNHFIKSLRRFNLTKDNSILDIGCGNGIWLKELSDLGFKNLLGIDPFISQNVHHNNKLLIEKKSIFELGTDKKFDLIIMSHVLEHMDDQLLVLQKVFSILNNEGLLYIRIPVSDSYAFEHYRANWVQLDAPRHLFLHSRKSISYLSQMANFEIIDYIYDSYEFQFIGSEQYIRNISLFNDKRSYYVNPNSTIFSKVDIEGFRKMSEKVNTNSSGDQVCIVLRKKG